MPDVELGFLPKLVKLVLNQNQSMTFEFYVS